MQYRLGSPLRRNADNSYINHFPTTPMSKEFRNTSSMFVRQRFWAITLFHFLLIGSSVVLAWLLRFDFRIPFPTLLFSCAPVLSCSESPLWHASIFCMDTGVILA